MTDEKFTWNNILQGAYKNQKKQRRSPVKKEKFGKKEKTAKCSICGKSGTRLKFGKQTIIRCKEHIQQLNNKSEKHKVEFRRASNL